MKKILAFILLGTFLFSACEEQFEHDGRDSVGQYKYLSNSLLSGKWSHTLSIDSTVWVFESNEWKEYIYEKSSGQVLNRFDHGKYRIRYRVRNPSEPYIMNNRPEDDSERYTKFRKMGNTLVVYDDNMKSRTFIKLEE